MSAPQFICPGVQWAANRLEINVTEGSGCGSASAEVFADVLAEALGDVLLGARESNVGDSPFAIRGTGDDPMIVFTGPANDLCRFVSWSTLRKLRSFVLDPANRAAS